MAAGVAMSGPRLQAYVRLERAMLDLDAADDPLADALRDAMDPIWYALTEEERAVLDGRDIEQREQALPTVASRVEVVQTIGQTSPGLRRVSLEIVPSTSWAAA
jgi:hypothetical protein